MAEKFFKTILKNNFKKHKIYTLLTVYVLFKIIFIRNNQIITMGKHKSLLSNNMEQKKLPDSTAMTKFAKKIA